MIVAVAVIRHVVARVTVGGQFEFAPAAGLVADLNPVSPAGGLPVDAGLKLGGDAVERGVMAAVSAVASLRLRSTASRTSPVSPV